MGEVWRFTLAVLDHWIQLMAGVASVSVAVYLRLRQKSELATIAFWCIAVACFFWAFFLSWRDEYRERVRSEAKVEAQTRPRLTAEVSGIALGGHAAADMPQFQGPVLVIFLTIKNVGAPSILDGWDVVAIDNNGAALPTRPVLFSSKIQTLVFRQSDDTVPFVVSPEDDLPSKIAQTPIPSGGASAGHLVRMFQDPNVDWQTVALINVRFSDVTGAQHHVTWDRAKPGIQPGHFPYSPGLRRPSIK